jgi:RNA 2',3'-cyclic 3'-phosphodiesterase
VSVFVAWTPDDAALQGIIGMQNRARRALGPGAPPLRWQPAERLHMTLRYLGNRAQLPCSALHELPVALALRCLGTAPCTARLDCIDAWRRVLVARAAPSQALRDLFAGFEADARACGFAADEREPAPHVTLAHGKCSPVIEPPAPLDVDIAAVRLMESDGRGYRILASWPLSGTGQPVA